MTNTRQEPVSANADPCSKPCLAPVCTPALDAERRAQAGYWLAVACGCLICQEHIVKDARPRRK